MSQWFQVSWPVKDEHLTLSKAIDIVQHYLLRTRGNLTREQVAFATTEIWDAYRKGETSHLKLANKAIVSFDAGEDAKLKYADPSTVVHNLS
jgi:hypothetical protein